MFLFLNLCVLVVHIIFCMLHKNEHYLVVEGSKRGIRSRSDTDEKPVVGGDEDIDIFQESSSETLLEESEFVAETLPAFDSGSLENILH